VLARNQLVDVTKRPKGKLTEGWVVYEIEYLAIVPGKDSAGTAGVHDRPGRRQGEIMVTDNFELDLFRASGDHEPFFVLGVSSDDDSSG
jgi:hypothetical protein